MSFSDSYFLPFQRWKELPFYIQSQLKVVNELLYFTFTQANDCFPALKQAESITQRQVSKNSPSSKPWLVSPFFVMPYFPSRISC